MPLFELDFLLFGFRLSTVLRRKPKAGQKVLP